MFDNDNMQGALASLGLKAEPKEIATIMRMIDNDFDGEIDLEEFSALVHKLMFSSKRVRTAMARERRREEMGLTSQQFKK